MLEVQVAIPPKADIHEVERLVEAGCAAEELQPTLKGTLAKYPGSVHWHLKKGNHRGTLEITLWKAERRLWFKVQAGRGGAWIEAVIPRLKQSWKEPPIFREIRGEQALKRDALCPLLGYTASIVEGR